MATWGQLKTDVAEHLGGAANPRSRYLARLGLQEALEHANRRSVAWFLVAFANTTLADGAVLYSGPTDFNVHIATILLNADGNRIAGHVNFLPEADFLRLGMNVGSLVPHEGAPRWLTYEVGASQFRIDRDPGAAYDARKMRTAYYKRLAMPTSGGSENEAGTLGLSSEVEDWIKQEGIWRAKRKSRAGGPWQEDYQIAKDAEALLVCAERSVDASAHGVNWRTV